jgi:hypothetical protein
MFAKPASSVAKVSYQSGLARFIALRKRTTDLGEALEQQRQTGILQAFTDLRHPKVNPYEPPGPNGRNEIRLRTWWVAMKRLRLVRHVRGDGQQLCSRGQPMLGMRCLQLQLQRQKSALRPVP